MKFSKHLSATTIALTVSLLFLFYLLNWNSVAAPFERDEGEYAYSAMIFRDGGVPYRDSFLQKPPMVVYTYALGQFIDPTAVWPPRVIALIFSLATIILIGYITYKEWGKQVAWLAVYVYTIASMFPVFTPFAANTEKFMILPLMGAIALYVMSRNRKIELCSGGRQQNAVFVLSGALTAFAVLYKPIAAPLLFALHGMWFFQIYRQDHDMRKTVVSITYFVCGGIVATTLVMLPIFLLGGFEQFLAQVVIFNSGYVASFGLGISNAINYATKFVFYWWILFIPFIAYLIKRPRHWYLDLVLSSAGVFTVYATPIGHYYLLVMPFVALIASAGIFALSEQFVGARKFHVFMGASVLTAVLMLAPFAVQYSLTPTQLVNWVYGTVNPFSEAQEVASHVAEITGFKEKIFVAGSEPEIYFYAQRKSVSKFIITYPLNLPTTYREQFQHEAVYDLTQNPPTVIVLAHRDMSGLWDEDSPRIFIDYLENLLSENYHPIGGYVWDEFGGYWEDTLTENLIESSSYVVYRKNSE